jgi:hypothetical protein
MTRAFRPKVKFFTRSRAEWLRDVEGVKGFKGPLGEGRGWVVFAGELMMEKGRD